MLNLFEGSVTHLQNIEGGGGSWKEMNSLLWNDRLWWKTLKCMSMVGCKIPGEKTRPQLKVWRSVCVCVWFCKHRQPRTYLADTPHSDWGQHCKWRRSTIYGYVQTVANCLLLHRGMLKEKKEKIMCTGFGPRFSAEKSYTSCVSTILHTKCCW